MSYLDRLEHYAGLPVVSFDPEAADPAGAAPAGEVAWRVEGDDGGKYDNVFAAFAALVDPAQVVGAGLALRALVEDGIADGERTLGQALDLLEERLREHGVTYLGRGYHGDYAAVRRQEVAAVLNRLRTLRIRRQCQERK